MTDRTVQPPGPFTQIEAVLFGVCLLPDSPAGVSQCHLGQTESVRVWARADGLRAHLCARWVYGPERPVPLHVGDRMTVNGAALVIWEIALKAGEGKICLELEDVLLAQQRVDTARQDAEARALMLEQLRGPEPEGDD